MDLTKELIAYVFFGVLTTIVNFITYFLFEGVFGINYLISNIIAWFVSVLFHTYSYKLFIHRLCFENSNTYRSGRDIPDSCDDIFKWTYPSSA